MGYGGCAHVDVETVSQTVPVAVPNPQQDKDRQQHTPAAKPVENLNLDFA